MKPNIPNNVSSKSIYKQFMQEYLVENNELFIETQETRAFVYTLIYYFQNKPNFFNSPLLYKIDGVDLSLEKGLLIIGGYGTGKSSVLRTFQKLINIRFKSPIQLKFETAINIVHQYENLPQEDLILFYNKYTGGFRVIDDLKSENEASRYGKKDLFKEILFNRLENRKVGSIITCNYMEENPNNLNTAIEEFNRYGPRVYDRLFSNFNFIQLKGKSMRK